MAGKENKTTRNKNVKQEVANTWFIYFLTSHIAPKTMKQYEKYIKNKNPHNKMPSLIPTGVLVENYVKFHDDSKDFFHKNTIKMSQKF